MIDFACCVKDDCSHYNPGAPEPETEAEKCPVACASVTYVYYDLNESTEVGTVSLLHYIEKILSPQLFIFSALIWFESEDLYQNRRRQTGR